MGEEDDEPENPRAWCELAVAHLAAGRPEAALRAATAAAELDPLSEWAHRLVSLGHSRIGDDREALAPAREAVRLAPGSWPSRVRLAEVLRRTPGRWGEAREQAGLAARFAPEEPEPQVVLGDLALLRGAHREAATHYRTALSTSPPAREPDAGGQERGARGQARINLGLALLRWDRPRAHHDPAWPVDPRETGRARRALEVWSRQVRLLLAVTTLAVAGAALALDRGGEARLAGVAVLLAVVPITVRQARRVRLWSHVPAMLARDPWLGTAVASAVLSVAAFTLWLVLPVVPATPGLAPVLDPLWAGLAGVVVLGWPALAGVRLFAEVWRGRPVLALEQFAAAAGERVARRDVVVARWLLVGRAWSAQLALAVVALAVDPRGAVLGLAVPYLLHRASRRGGPVTGDRWLGVAFALVLAGAVACATGGLTGWVWAWRAGLGAKLAVVLVFALRAVRAWWRGAPGPGRASLLMAEDLLDAETRPPVALDPEVRQALAYARGVVVAFGDERGPRVAGVIGTVSALGELRLIAGEEVWAAIGTDPRVAVFAADALRRRYWVEVRGVAWAEGDLVRVTPKQVLVTEFPGRHQRR
ncbi:hypothetical protein ACIBG7_29010 [Nonomuraea sp. NPDC050328]|uniref:hypothetical protein n=1 Tax=Nonomuraea sp. NPDC050328 TaxID=3364361 RepID=UPI00378DEFA8